MASCGDTNELLVKSLLETAALRIRDITCTGACRHRSPTESATTLNFVFPYRGLFVRHVGAQETVAELNQLIFFNENEEYEVSHPVEGADACLSIAMDPSLVGELVPAGQLADGYATRFVHSQRRIDPRAQALLALLRHGLHSGAMEPLEAETATLTLIRRALGERTSHVRSTTYGRAKLVDRTKLILMSNPSRRWTLAAIAREVGVSPVYLTQVFAQVEGVPLYGYQTRLRLARALDLLGERRDLTTLALELGFSSHSHFTAAFRQLYGRSPANFQRTARVRG